jgi:hypothetical protein
MKVLLALPLLLATSGAALANDKAAADVTIPGDAVLHCRALGDTSARLACYDAIPVARAAAPAPEQNFGLQPPRKAEPETPAFIESTITGSFEGWGPGTQFTLANGQVWRVADGSDAVLPPMRDPKVRIVRNFFGTTFLEIPGTNSSPSVRRVR